MPPFICWFQYAVKLKLLHIGVVHPIKHHRVDVVDYYYSFNHDFRYSPQSYKKSYKQSTISLKTCNAVFRV